MSGVPKSPCQELLFKLSSAYLSNCSHEFPLEHFQTSIHNPNGIPLLIAIYVCPCPRIHNIFRLFSESQTIIENSPHEECTLNYANWFLLFLYLDVLPPVVAHWSNINEIYVKEKLLRKPLWTHLHLPLTTSLHHNCSFLKVNGMEFMAKWQVRSHYHHTLTTPMLLVSCSKS